MIKNSSCSKHRISRRTCLKQLTSVGCSVFVSSAISSIPTPAAWGRGTQRYIRDAQIEALLSEALNPIVSSLGYIAKDFRFVILEDPNINAFVAGEAVIFINSGLLRLVPDIEVLQAILAHEFAHYHAGHIPRLRSQKNEILARVLVGSLLAIPIALIAQRGDALAAGIVAPFGVGQLAALRYTRSLEEEADHLALQYLQATHIHPDALVRSLKSLQRHAQQNSESQRYLVTHPLTEDRIRRAQIVATQSQLPRRPLLRCGEQKNSNALSLSCRLMLVKGKLRGFLDQPRAVQSFHQGKSDPYDAIATCIAAMRLFQHMTALDLANKLRLQFPNEAYMHELYGDVAAHAGAFQQAHNAYQLASEMEPKSVLIRYSWLRNINNGNLNVSTEELETRLVNHLSQRMTMVPFLNELARFYHRFNLPHLRELYLAEAALILNKPGEAKSRLSPYLSSYKRKHYRQQASDILLEAESLGAK